MSILRAVWKTVYGQMIALTIVFGGVFCTYLSNNGVYTTLLNMWPVYFLLSFNLIFSRKLPRKASPKLYALLALFDIHGNTLLVKSYSYTTLTSVTALNFLGIPTTMFLSMHFMGAKYYRVHYIGVLTSLFGLLCVILSDISQSEEGNLGIVSMLLGDAMAFSGIVFLSASNVFQEKILLMGDTQTSVLGLWGVIGTVLASIEGGLLKEYVYLNYFKDWRNVGYFLGFTIACFATYELAPAFISRYSATLFNLSNLATPIYASFFQHWLFERGPLFYIGVTIIISGIGIFSLREPLYRLEDEIEEGLIQ